jgi:hypothetical protein
MCRNISKVFNEQDSTADILLSLEENGLVLFSDMASGFNRLYERIRSALPEGTMQGYTNHPTEGYFYFICDSDLYTLKEATSRILKFRLE